MLLYLIICQRSLQFTTVKHVSKIAYVDLSSVYFFTIQILVNYYSACSRGMKFIIIPYEKIDYAKSNCITIFRESSTAAFFCSCSPTEIMLIIKVRAGEWSGHHCGIHTRIPSSAIGLNASWSFQSVHSHIAVSVAKGK